MKINFFFTFGEIKKLAMKKNLILLILIIISLSLVRAQQPRGIDLGEYAFGIPADQLNFSNQSPFTLSFWVNIKEFNHVCME